MKQQKSLIHDLEWDYLLVLDDCRWDTFRELYRDYLDVDTEAFPVWSAGSHTIHWLSETWPDEYPEITYVSGHAIVNSEGIPGLYAARKQANRAGVDGDYVPADHFPDIIDVWDDGYHNTMESVPPWAMNVELRQAGPPTIGHYVQPHFPWIRGHLYAEEHGIDFSDATPRTEWSPEPGGTAPRFCKANVRAKLGVDGVKMAYRDNLRVVLEAVDRLLPDLEGRVVITSDHGELFGEGETHPPGSDRDELRTVPWVVVDA